LPLPVRYGFRVSLTRLPSSSSSRRSGPFSYRFRPWGSPFRASPKTGSRSPSGADASLDVLSPKPFPPWRENGRCKHLPLLGWWKNLWRRAFRGLFPCFRLNRRHFGYFTKIAGPTNSPGLSPLQSTLADPLFARLPGEFPHGVFRNLLLNFRKAVKQKPQRPFRAFKKTGATSILSKIVDSPEVFHLFGGSTALKGSRAGL
jgi:hypothetical protein